MTLHFEVWKREWFYCAYVAFEGERMATVHKGEGRGAREPPAFSSPSPEWAECYAGKRSTKKHVHMGL